MNMKVIRGVRNYDGREVIVVKRSKASTIKTEQKPYELFRVPVPPCVLWRVDFDVNGRGVPCFLFECRDNMFKGLYGDKRTKVHTIEGDISSVNNLKTLVRVALKQREFEGFFTGGYIGR